MPKTDNQQLLAQLVADARNGRLSRREFISYAMAAGMMSDGCEGSCCQ